MKATPSDQDQLLRLQTADTRLAQLGHTIDTLPQLATRAALEPEVNAKRARWMTVTGVLEDTRTEVSRIESDLKVVENRIARDTERLTATASPKDVQALEIELAALSRRQMELEDAELGAMERLVELETEQAEAEAERADLAARVDALEVDLDVERQKVQTERDALLRDRAVIAEGIPVELLALYEKQRARYGIGAALLHHGVSLGSHVTLTESDLSEIRRAAPDDVVLCPDSGAILIRNSESGL